MNCVEQDPKGPIDRCMYMCMCVYIHIGEGVCVGGGGPFFSSLALKLSAYVRTSLGSLTLKGFCTKVKIECGRPKRSQNLARYVSDVSDVSDVSVIFEVFCLAFAGFWLHSTYDTTIK